MKHDSWTRLQANSSFNALYGRYRQLPEGVRSFFRMAVMPHWEIAPRLLFRESKGMVVAGPLKGLKLELSAVSKRLLCGYILGTQELELRDVVDRMLKRGYRTIVNVGAADGYYAVGFARGSPDSRIVAFEAIDSLHPVIRRSARLNHVSERLRVEGLCNPSDLVRELEVSSDPTLVFTDIEGFETKLLDPAAVPALKDVDIFLESHDSFVPGCTDLIIRRFSETHVIERFVARERTIEDFPKDFLPALSKTFPKFTVELMNERRLGTQQWLFLKSKLLAERTGTHT